MKARIHGGALTILYGALGILVLASLWTALSWTNPTGAKFPSLGRIFEAIVDNWTHSAVLAYNTFGSGGIWSNLMATASNVLVAVAIGLLVGYTIGIALVRVEWFSKLSRMPLMILGTIPVLVIHPFLTLWFGASRLAMGGMVIFYTALTITEAVRSAATRAMAQWGDYAASLGISGFRMTYSVLVPASFPASMGTLRAALAFGWGFQSVAEVLGGSTGAGRMIRTFADSTNTAGVIGILLCVGVLAVLVDAVVAGAGKWAGRWSE